MPVESWRPAPGSATGIGSMPGEDPVQATRAVFDELPDLPHLPELPARGPGADLVGRTAALLPGLHVDLQPSGWRLVDRPGLDERRAHSLLSRDLDALEEVAAGYRGPLKVSLAGPWTLAAALRLPRGEPALSDRVAGADLAAALAEAAAEHVAEVARRLPDTEPVLQLDEPSLPAVLAGAVRSTSGWRAFDPVPSQTAQTRLSETVSAVGAPVVVHCCAARPPVGLLAATGASGISIDLGLVGSAADEELGAALEAGVLLLAGVVPPLQAGLSAPADTVGPVRGLWSRLGLDPGALAGSVVVTPTCGLAGAGPEYARTAMRLARDAGRLLLDDPEG
jgi:methionine synthase II (cobalamin-independent)